MRRLIYKIFPFVGLLALVSCTKEIDVDLNSSNPKLVVEANIYEGTGPFYVQLTRTVNFDESNTFPADTNALVIISNDLLQTDTLLEVSPGIYQTQSIQGIANHNYSLYIQTQNGNVYTSDCYLNPGVVLDTVTYFSQSGGFGGDPVYLFTPVFNDIAGTDNYYKFVLYSNGAKLDYISVSLDDAFEGVTNNRPLIFRGPEVAPGVMVTVELQSISSEIYEYYFSFLQLSSFGPNQSASPSNPVSNIEGTDVLGYFNAYSYTRKSVIIQ
jgi:hypothetical protein